MKDSEIPSEDISSVLRLRRELHRLRTSPSLRLGAHITNAMRQPWKAPFLPLTLPWMMLIIGLEMLGRRPSPPSLEMSHFSSKSDQTVVMFPTNGVGFGHFTRLLAIAKRMKAKNPGIEIVFFTTMPTLHILKEHGFPAHHVSGHRHFTGLDSTRWNALIEEELNLLFDFHRPSTFVFDGAFPYRGMLRAIGGRPDIDSIWMRRGSFKDGANIPVDSIQHFDLVIHPEDAFGTKANRIEHDVETRVVPPILLLDDNELMSRDAARKRLSLPLDSTVVYVQLGAGEINSIDSEIRMTIEALTSHDHVHVVLGESMIGSRLETNLERVHIIRDYPNMRYRNAFDMTVQAGGYNSFHEARQFNLPTLFLPNMDTGMDDQLSRCRAAESEGWGFVLEERDFNSIDQAIASLLSFNIEVENKVANGSAVVSDILLDRIERS